MRAAARFTLAVVVALVGGPVNAAPGGDAVAVYRSATAELAAKEKTYWGEFPNRFTEGMAQFETPWQKAHYDEKAPQDRTWDYAPLLALYGDFVALEVRYAEAAEALATSAHTDAAGVLFADLLKALDRADKAEEQMAEQIPFLGLHMCDQHFGVLRHGLARYEARLLPALARCPGAVAMLAGDGWKRAVKGDGKDSVLRRVAVIDAVALAAATDPAASSFLGEQTNAKSSTLRVAALEGLLRAAPAATPALVRLAADASPVVRIALFQTIRALPKRDSRWIRPVLARHAEEKGRLRAETLETLRVLSGTQTADDPTAWKKWVDENAAAVDAGTFEPKDDRGPAASTDAKAPLATFYGSTAVTLAPVYAVPATFIVHYPAEADVQATRNSARWPPRAKPAWDDPPPVHHGFICRQLKKSIASLAPGAEFALFGGHRVCEPLLFEKGAMVKASPAAAADAARFAEQFGLPGYCSPYEALCHAMRIAGLDPSPGADDFREMRADTVFLLQTGAPNGGRYVAADPVVEAFLRLNRFRRLAVHAIRIGCEREQADETMRRIGEGSGGSYHWQMKPPAE